VPDWIAIERAREELARMTSAERAYEEIASAVVEFVRDEDITGWVIMMWPSEQARKNGTVPRAKPCNLRDF